MIKSYLMPITLILSILLGGIAGYLLGPNALYLKPLGDIFLNLLFTVLVPLVFFSVASAVAQIGVSKQFGKLLITMLGVFLFTSVVAALFMLVVVLLFPPISILSLPTAMQPPNQINFANQLVTSITTPDFISLFTHLHMLPLIVFSLIVGLATAATKEKGSAFARFLESGVAISMKMVSFIMYYAPMGFFAYFAVLVSELGPKLIGTYLHITLIYYLAGLFYFIFIFTFYAYLANKKQGVAQFWKHILLPSLTSLSTCSSAASIPANLQATKEMGIPPYIYETVVPLGAVLHKDGSVLGGMLKIAFLFGIFHLSFAGPGVLLTAIGISILVGVVMGAIPSGGMLGELLILSFYGFPPESLMLIAAISILIDPLATMLNVTGDCVGSMLVKKFLT